MSKSLLEKSRELNKMVRQIPVHPKGRILKALPK